MMMPSWEVGLSSKMNSCSHVGSVPLTGTVVDFTLPSLTVMYEWNSSEIGEWRLCWGVVGGVVAWRDPPHPPGEPCRRAFLHSTHSRDMVAGWLEGVLH